MVLVLYYNTKKNPNRRLKKKRYVQKDKLENHQILINDFTVFLCCRYKDRFRNARDNTLCA